jgi:hypothetical protein
MKTLIDLNLLQRPQVGPLAPYLEAYLKHIKQEGFVPSSAPMQMYAIARFSNGSAIGNLTCTKQMKLR